MKRGTLKAGFVFAALCLAGVFSGRAEFLFAPADPSPNGLFTPTLDFPNISYKYSAWDIFYAPRGEGNYPDVFAPYGGYWNGTGWARETRTDANTNANGSDAWTPPGGFAPSPFYNPSDPLAFWDTRNATITQTKSNTTFIISPDYTGNIYTFQDKTGYQLHNVTDYANGLGSVIFQFQTDGTNVDFGKIRLGYKAEDGNTYYLGVNDPETEYLREYSTTGSDHWSATAGYRNRVLLQWDLSGVQGTGEYWIEWESLSSSMSFQMADLVTTDTYQVGMPASSTWVGQNGDWSESINWQGQGGSVPLENGNLKFKNSSAVAVNIDDASHLVGEIIFDNAADVTIGSTGNFKLISNTGITTRSTLPDADDRVYQINTNYDFGALNFFEINKGKVVMNGDISGSYGMVKLGAGTLELNGDNTFTGFLAVQDGTLRIGGTNSYAGSTTVVNGRIIMANAGAFGGSTALTVGGDADLYAFTTGAASWMAELMIEGDLVLNWNITLGAGDLGKRLGAFNTTNGAEFSGNISFSGVVANPDAPGGSSAVGNTRITAQEASDHVTFSGQMTGGRVDKTIILDGQGTVVYSGADKTYGNSTLVSSGTLLIASGTSLAGQGNVTVSHGARMQVDGGLTSSGNMLLNGGTLEVNGIIAGSGLFAFNGGVLTGSGTVNRDIALNTGDVISPGNSPGILNTASQTWGGGGAYLWEISDLGSEEGIGWDLLVITGALSIGATEGNPFEIQISSLTFDHIAGELADFSDVADYSWIIASASGGIFGFDEASFEIRTDGFANDFTGRFDVSQIGNHLMLNYSAIPEPSTWALAILAAIVFFRARKRRKSKAAACRHNLLTIPPVTP